MKKTTLTSLLVLFSILVFSQTISKKEFKTKIICMQKHGLEAIESDFVLTVIYDDNTIKFNTNEGKTMSSYSIAKKTQNYVIGRNDEGNYCFYDIKKKHFFYVDYYMNSYSTAGYGATTPEIKQITLNMMDLLKGGKTQKDVIQHLVSQTEYDF